jgi:hypothetical protein
MMGPSGNVRIYLACGVTDMRCGINGLSALVVTAIHKAQGWSDIGYNEIINPNGRAEMGRGKIAVGAHVAGFNSIS